MKRGEILAEDTKRYQQILEYINLARSMDEAGEDPNQDPNAAPGGDPNAAGGGMPGGDMGGGMRWRRGNGCCNGNRSHGCRESRSESN